MADDGIRLVSERRETAGAGDSVNLIRQVSAVLESYEKLRLLVRSGACSYSPEAIMSEALRDWRKHQNDARFPAACRRCYSQTRYSADAAWSRSRHCK